MISDTYKIGQGKTYKYRVSNKKHLHPISHQPGTYLLFGNLGSGKSQFVSAIATKSYYGFFKVNKKTEIEKNDEGKEYTSKYITPTNLMFEKRLDILENQFNNLISSTWSYLFDKKQQVEMSDLSKGMLDDVKKMKELSEKFQESDENS